MTAGEQRGSHPASPRPDTIVLITLCRTAADASFRHLAAFTGNELRSGNVRILGALTDGGAERGRMNPMPLRLCILLWESAERAGDLAAFEDAVLALLPNHGGRLLTRDRVLDRQDDDPLEIQLIEIPDEEALAGFLRDPVRIDLARTHGRDAIIARTQLLRVQPRG